METHNNQITRWILPKPVNDEEIADCKINFTLQKVLSRRGINIDTELKDYLKPSNLPDPEKHFKQLKAATQRIIVGCKNKEVIAICGDYDADGITSTVLLVELLSKLGAKAIPYIPSRKDDGYGLNIKMINEINSNDISLVITVDNGISSFDAIKRANELDIDLIITDHHKISKHDLDIFSLIHPEYSPKNSPYRYLAGVGIAYLLAKNICKKLKFDIDTTSANVLFCIGTVADMAPLKGANRKWLKECLPKINNTKNKGIRSILKKLSIDGKDITSDDIGYKIAPLINAVGRIGDPKKIIELLTIESLNSINTLVKECFSINKERKRLTTLVEQEAIEIALREYSNNKKFLVLTKREWHPGIIGIVSARMVDKFNLPTAIISEASNGIFRGSIRSNNLIKVNLALDECKDILIAYGGHSSAAGFSIKEENIAKLKNNLNRIAIRELNNENLIKSIKPDAYMHLKDITCDFYKQLILVGPFGMKNPAPIFWTRKCRVLYINRLNGGHMKLKLHDGTASIDAIKWNPSLQTLNTDDLIDIAFKIELNRWKKSNKLQLNIIDIKKYHDIIDLKLHKKNYKCHLTNNMDIIITNSKGQSITSDLSKKSYSLNKKQEEFFKTILTFAEIALGKAA